VEEALLVARGADARQVAREVGAHAMYSSEPATPTKRPTSSSSSRPLASMAFDHAADAGAGHAGDGDPGAAQHAQHAEVGHGARVSRPRASTMRRSPTAGGG
jgi:hypothetical protein